MDENRVRELLGEAALARAVLYRVGSLAFRHPDAEWWAEWPAAFGGTVTALDLLMSEVDPLEELQAAVRALAGVPRRLTDLQRAHARLFGHTPRGGVTPYETEWSRGAGGLLQFHVLADVCGFYRAYGLELSSTCGERPDHVSIELSFMHALCLKEAHGEEHGIPELVEACRAAARTFLAEHLAPWALGLCARLRRADPEGFHGRAARLLQLFLEVECARLDIVPGDPAAPLPESSLTLEECCVSCENAPACSADPARIGGADG